MNILKNILIIVVVIMYFVPMTSEKRIKKDSIEATKPKKPSATYRHAWKKDPKVLRVGIVAFQPAGGHHVAAVGVKSAIDRLLGDKCKTKIVNLYRMPKYGEDTYNDKVLPRKKQIQGIIDSQIKLLTLTNVLFQMGLYKSFDNLYDFYRALRKLDTCFVADEIDAHTPQIYNHDWSQFDLIIATTSRTHNAIAFDIPEIKKNKIPIVCISTDTDDYFYGHSIASRNILYLLCSDALMRRAKRMQVREFRRISGLPLRPEFDGIREISKADMKKKLGFSPYEPLILVAFGHVGSDVAKEILQIIDKVNVICVLGRDQETRTALDVNPRHRILQSVSAQEMAEFIRAADLIAGKPGGLTTFEVLECETPMAVVLRYIIPNEKANMEILLRNGCCKMLNSWTELPDAIEEIMSDPWYKDGPAKFSNNASQEIAIMVEDIAENYDDWRERLWGTSMQAG